MKRLFTLGLSISLLIWLLGVAQAQGHSSGHANKQASGKPAVTGVEHAEATANANGQRGIENAETKQARTATHKGKKLTKTKAKKHAASTAPTTH